LFLDFLSLAIAILAATAHVQRVSVGPKTYVTPALINYWRFELYLFGLYKRELHTKFKIGQKLAVPEQFEAILGCHIRRILYSCTATQVNCFKI
jgi:hypothetical protein